MPDVIKLNGWQSTYNFVSRYIKDPFLRRVFSFHPLLIGGNPYDTPALYTLIVKFEKEWGVYYAKGGTGAIVDGLGRLFTDIGGKIHLNSEIKEIIIKNRRASGIELYDNSKEEFDAIVCNGDVSFAYRHLIPENKRIKWTNKKIDSFKYSNSLFVIYFGTKRRYLDSKFHHHNIIVNNRYKNLLKEVFDKAILPEDFSLYLHMPTITDSSIAPEGCESFYVLSLVPNLDSGTDWKDIGISYRDSILKYLEENYLPDLRKNIVALHHIDPVHFHETLNSYKGAAFAMKPTLMQSAYLRPHPISEEFENLYFVGAGTHPGAGVPSVLSSGKIAANLIDPS
jgi:phytoene desaturase